MNTSPYAKRILCFGDSNTWGRKPGDDNEARFSANERWTGVLQELLGDDYEIIEEGLNGRTLNLESDKKAGKNGSKYLFPCLETQKPIDMIILSLGTNDLKAKYGSTVQSIMAGLQECLDIISKEARDLSGDVPQILILSVPIIKEIERLRFGSIEVDFLGAHEKSIQLLNKYKQISKEHNIEFLDITKDIQVSDVDGAHLDKTNHGKLGELIYRYIANANSWPI